MRSELLYLVDVYTASLAIDEFMIGVDKETFLSSDLLQSAVLQKLTVIGEGVARLSEDTKERYPQVDWKSIIGMRNVIVHVYFSINWEIIWVAVTENMDSLQEHIRQILSIEFPDFDIETHL